MNVLVFGAGALGSLLGAFLSAKHDVTLVGRAAHMEAIRLEGLHVEGLRSFVVRPRARTRLEGDEAPTLVVVAVKAYDTPQAASALAPVITPATTVITVQNGLGNLEALHRAFPASTVLAASATYGTYLAAPGRVRFTSQGELVVGGAPSQFGTASLLSGTLRGSGLLARAVQDVTPTLWLKAVINAAINPLTAIAGRPNGALSTDARLRDRMRRAATEAAAVAAAKGIDLPERDIVAVVDRIVHSTATNRSSMLEDVTRGRRTEVDAITGVFVAEGLRLGVPTPENAAILAEIHALTKPA